MTRVIATRPDLWPGVLFWTPDGTSAFAPLAEAYGLCNDIYEAIRRGDARIDNILNKFNLASSKSASRRLLHISDLHFGTPFALENRTLLDLEILKNRGEFDRIVVTGDLFDNPKRADALVFENCRTLLEVKTGKKLIIVPGNHDERLYGNIVAGLGQDLSALVNLEWSSVIVDDDIKCIFYCFDSALEKENFARCRVGVSQMKDVAKLFEKEAAIKPDIRDYEAVALVHHHPYPFNGYEETKLQSVLKTFGLAEKSVDSMIDTETLMEWCAGRRVSLMLHGHKHFPRHVEKTVNWNRGGKTDTRAITAIGCGTSLGAEGLSLSYNVVEWSPSTRKWTVSFFAALPSGTEFEEVHVAVHSAS
jgi:predicted MPP superfamily phosphohydrolase